MVEENTTTEPVVENTPEPVDQAPSEEKNESVEEKEE
jgi:hypothetical protein